MKRELPEISVVIPTYNRPESLTNAVFSVLEAAHKSGANVDIVVVNDRSEADYSVSLTKLPKEVTYIENAAREGVSYSRNVGISASKSDWVVFLDDDDRFLPNYVELLIGSIRRESETKIFFTGARILSNDAQAGYTERLFDADQERRQIIKDFLSIGMGFGVAIHKDVFYKVGPFDTSFQVAEDTELFFKALVAGYVPSIIPGINIVKSELGKDRLSITFRLYSELNVYDRIFERYERYLVKYMKYNYIHMLMWAYRCHRMYRNVSSESCSLSKLLNLGIPEWHINACYTNGEDIADEFTLVSVIN